MLQPDTPNDLYATILRYAAVPVLIVLLLLSWGIINYLMSAKWQQRRRAKQIRKAVAARQALMAEAAAAREQAAEEPGRERPVC
jgi:hypothetical protein